jgi:hypothetical protein
MIKIIKPYYKSRRTDTIYREKFSPEKYVDFDENVQNYLCYLYAISDDIACTDYEMRIVKMPSKPNVKWYRLLAWESEMSLIERPSLISVHAVISLDDYLYDLEFCPVPTLHSNVCALISDHRPAKYLINWPKLLLMYCFDQKKWQHNCFF